MSLTSPPRHLLSLLDLSSAQVQNLLTLAAQTKSDFKKNGPNNLLQGKTSVLIFEKPSLRTRVTFEVALAHFGGTTINLQPTSISLGKRESVEDAAKNLGRWVDCIVARTFQHSLVEELAKYAQVPVINALTDLFHPCQALAFGLTAIEHQGSLQGKNVVFVGDGNNVANCLAILCAHVGANFTLCCPRGYEQPKFLQERLSSGLGQTGKNYSIQYNPEIAVQKADFIYTDVWVSMGEENIGEQKGKDFIGYQVNSSLLKKAPAHCQVSHCLPAHRGEEITSEVMDSHQSICFDEAENRLHVQKAVLLALLHPTYTL